MFSPRLSDFFPSPCAQTSGRLPQFLFFSPFIYGGIQRRPKPTISFNAPIRRSIPSVLFLPLSRIFLFFLSHQAPDLSSIFRSSRVEAFPLFYSRSHTTNPVMCCFNHENRLIRMSLEHDCFTSNLRHCGTDWFVGVIFE